MNEDQCKEEVHDNDMWPPFRLCTRKAVEEGFCRQHSPSKKTAKEARLKRESAIRDLQYDLDDAAAAIVGALVNFGNGSITVGDRLKKYLAVKAKIDAVKAAI